MPQLIDELKKQGAWDVVVTVGGIIPSKDYKMLESAGVKAISSGEIRRFFPSVHNPAARRVYYPGAVP
jgi:methylmalonyl-CoA mutase cobalamin-binding domain/chain